MATEHSLYAGTGKQQVIDTKQWASWEQHQWPRLIGGKEKGFQRLCGGTTQRRVEKNSGSGYKPTIFHQIKVLKPIRMNCKLFYIFICLGVFDRICSIEVTQKITQTNGQCHSVAFFFNWDVHMPDDI